MKTEINARDDHQVQLIAEADEEMVERFRRDAARKISSSTRIPGFRPGKAPYDVVRRLYGDQAIHEEAINLMINDLYPQAISEAKINPGGMGKLDEILQADPPRFSFIVPLAPEVDLGNYRDIRVDYQEPVVEDGKIEDVLARLQRRSAISTPVERKAKKGDMVALEVSGTLLDPDEGADPVLVPQSKRNMIAGDPSDASDMEGHEWPFSGFSKLLVGMKAGDEKEHEHTFPNDGSNDDLGGKTAKFTIKVESVSQLELHPLDDEFAQSVGSQFETLEKLREQIANDLKTDTTSRYNQTYMDEVIGKLVEGAKVKYAPSVLDEEVEHSLGHFQERLAGQKMDLDMYLKARELTREEFIDKEVKPEAEKSIVRNMVLEEFATKENIQLTPEEARTIMEMAENQSRSDPSLKALARGKTTKRDVAQMLARRTLNEIFSARLTARLKELASGKLDQPAVEESAVEEKPEPKKRTRKTKKQEEEPAS